MHAEFELHADMIAHEHSALPLVFPNKPAEMKLYIVDQGFQLSSTLRHDSNIFNAHKAHTTHPDRSDIPLRAQRDSVFGSCTPRVNYGGRRVQKLARHRDSYTRIMDPCFRDFCDTSRSFLERSGQFEIDASFCHLPFSKHASEVNFSEASLGPIADTSHRHAHRLRNLSVWNVSDMVVCAVMKGLLNSRLPHWTKVSIPGQTTTYPHYY